MRSPLASIVALGVALASTDAFARPPAAGPPPSTSEATAACMRSAEKAQLLRRQGKLLAARAALVVCAADDCPAVVRDDCRTWTAEVQAAEPTLVFSVRGSDGTDLVNAKVSVDGAPFVDHIDGLARPLDPGPHDIEVTAPSETPVRMRIVVHEGAKQRVVPIAFPAREPPADTAKSSPADAATTRAPITPWVYVIGATAVVGVAGFAFLGLTALSDHSAMQDGCAVTHSCSDDAVQANKALFWAADVSLLVGVAAAGITGYLLYDHAHAPSASSPRAGDLRMSARCVGGPFVELKALF